MNKEPSKGQVTSVSKQLFILDNADACRQHALKLAQRSRRHIKLFSTQLDFLLYDNDDFSHALSQLARQNRHSDIQLLIKDSKTLVERGHHLIRLAQRLPSKIQVRCLTDDMNDSAMSFMLVDNHGLLYQHNDGVYHGFANYDAGPEVKNLKPTFERLWQHSLPDASLQQLKI